MSRLAVGIAISFGVIFAAFGLAFLIHAGLLVNDDFTIDRTTPAEGIVLATTKKSRPTIEFRVADGRLVRFTSSSQDFSYSVGERVVVFYDPRQPEKATVKTSAERLKDFVTAGAVGIIFVIAMGRS
jgi:hypothetical protein